MAGHDGGGAQGQQPDRTAFPRAAASCSASGGRGAACAYRCCGKHRLTTPMRSPSGCYPLVPFGNRVKGNRFTFRGKDYAFEPNTPWDPHYLHGEGWQSEWTVLSQHSSEAEFRFSHAGHDTPYAYEARQRFAIHDDRFDMHLEVRNVGAEALPFGSGLASLLSHDTGHDAQGAGAAVLDGSKGLAAGGGDGHSRGPGFCNGPRVAASLDQQWLRGVGRLCGSRLARAWRSACV